MSETVLSHCWLGARKGIRPVKTLTFLVPAHPGSPGRAVKRVCVMMERLYQIGFTCLARISRS